MQRILINELHVKMELPIDEAKKCIQKNNNCKSGLNGNRATLIYSINQIEGITSLHNYSRRPHS